MYEMHKGDTRNNSDLDGFLKPSEMVSHFDCSHAELCIWEPYTALKHFLYEVRGRGKQYIVPDGADYVGGPEVPEIFRRIKRMLP